MTREEVKHYANCLKNNQKLDYNTLEMFCNEVINSQNKLQKIEDLNNDLSLKPMEAFYRIEEVLYSDNCN